MKTQICIVGGGPSGLLLSQLLHLQGIDTIVLEKHTRDYVLARIRAGVLEHGFAELMREARCGERMDKECEIHHGFFIARDGILNRVDLHKYSGGSSVVVYGQTELTRDLYDARDRMGGKVIHEAARIIKEEEPTRLSAINRTLTEQHGAGFGIQADFADDLRDYEMCGPMLRHFGIRSLRLMTNNPRKIDALKDLDIHIERLEHVSGSTRFNARYLATKARKLGHLLPPSFAPDSGSPTRKA